MICADADRSRRVPWYEFKRRWRLAHPLHDEVAIHSDVVGILGHRATFLSQDLFRFFMKEVDPNLFEHTHGAIVYSLKRVLIERFGRLVEKTGHFPLKLIDRSRRSTNVCRTPALPTPASLCPFPFRSHG